MATAQIMTQLLNCGILLLVGFACGRLKIIDEHMNRGITNLVILIVMPCVIFNSCQIDYSAELAENLLYALILSAVCVAVQTVAGYVFVRRKGCHLSIERLSAIFGNCGFMGLPIVQALCGAEGILYFTAYVTCTNGLLWTLGIMMVNGGTSRREQLKQLLSPALISVFVGLFFFLAQIRIPEAILAPIDSLSDLNTPLAMIVAGVSIAQSDYMHVFSSGRPFYIVFIRNIVAPILCIFAIALFPLSMRRSTEVMVILSACPVATVCTMLAQRYGKDASYAAQIFTLSTLLSVLTIPFIFMFADKVIDGFLMW